MFRKSRKDKLVDQAQGLAHDLTEAVVPRVEKAREDLKPVLSDVRDTGAARLADARDALAPKLADARDAGAARLADARDTAAPLVETARDRTILGVQQVVHDVRDQAHQAAEEAERRRGLATAALRGEDTRRSRKGRLLLVLALGAVGAVVGKKLAGGDQSDNWQSSYTPAPSTGPTDPAPATHPVTTPGDPAESVDVSDKPDPEGPPPQS